MPKCNPPPKQVAVILQPGEQIVKQRFDRAEIENADTVPVLGQHAREQGETGRFGLSPCCRCQQNCVFTVEHWFDCGLLKRPQPRPAKAVDDMML
ncbi:hypothetical protein D3C84_718810 [compost metagenome]